MAEASGARNPLRVWAGAARRALEELRAYEPLLDELNVFPVSDRDTGRNLRATLEPLVAAWERLGPSPSDPYDELARAAEPALRSARGNSGVILAAFLVGTLRRLREVPSGPGPGPGPGEVAEALREGLSAAHRAVLDPRPGTILTVLAALAEAARAGAGDGLLPLLEALFQAGRAALRRTPEQLPLLRRAGVVDAGGAGVVVLLQGLLRAFSDEALPREPLREAELRFSPAKARFRARPGGRGEDPPEPYDLQLTLRTERPRHKVERLVREIGTSGVVAGPYASGYRVHLHVRDPEAALQALRRLGTPEDVRVEDMRAQIRPEAEGGGLLAWADEAGGFADLFRALGIEVVADRGALLEAARRAEGPWILLPNSTDLLDPLRRIADGRGDLWVVPSRAPSEGVRALLAFDPRRSPAENARTMAAELARTATLRVRAQDGEGRRLEAEALRPAGWRGQGPPEALRPWVRRARERLRARGVRASIAVIYAGPQAPAALVEALRRVLEAEGLEVEVRRGDRSAAAWLSLEEG